MYGDSYFLKIAGVNLRLGPIGVKINIDSIAIDRQGSHLYFGAVTSDKLYSISTSHLLSYVDAYPRGGELPGIIEEKMKHEVKIVSHSKPISDGITTDLSGNIWITAFEHSALVIAMPEKDRDKRDRGRSDTSETFFGKGGAQSFKMVKVVQSESLLRWPDGFSFGPDGIYVTNSVIHLKFGALFAGKNISDIHGPFHILKISNENLQSIGINNGKILSGQ